MKRASGNGARVVILGGGYAGLTAALRLATLIPKASISLIDKNDAFIEKIRLHQTAVDNQVRSIRYEPSLAKCGVRFLRGAVFAVDPRNNSLGVTEPSGNEQVVPYDFLVWALGSNIDLTRVKGAREYGVPIDSPSAVAKIHLAFEQGLPRRVLVVGGGLTGIETANEISESRCRTPVTLVTAASYAAENAPGGFSAGAVAHLRKVFERNRIELREGITVQEIRKNEAQLSDGTILDFDLCIWTAGFRVSPLAREAGLQVNMVGQIETNAQLRSVSFVNIFAVGDAAGASTLESGHCRMSCATGQPMGIAAAHAIASLLNSKKPEPFRFRYAFRCISLGRKDGLIQFVDEKDIPRSLIWTGSKAARWKEYISRDAVGITGVRAREAPPFLPPLRMLPQLMRVQKQYR